MSLATYQGWEVGTTAGPTVYQCVMDAAPYRCYQQQQHRSHHHAEPKTNFSGLSMYIHHSSSHCEPTEPLTSRPCIADSTIAAAAASPVLHGECGPVSSYLLPSLSSYPGSERVALIGEELDLGKKSSARTGLVGWSNNSGGSQRLIRNGGHREVYPHDHDDDDDSYWRGSKKQPFPERKSSFESPCTKVCVGPALSSSSSSIGVGGSHSFSLSENGSDENGGDGEVQSALRPAPLSTLAALEDSLPIKRGLSRYFNGQSKSFGCLSDALSTSLAKPANPYARRRKGFALGSEERQRTCPAVSRKSASGISKKNSFGNKSNLALAVAMEAAQQEEDEDEDDRENDADVDDDDEEEDHPTPLPRMDILQAKSCGPARSYSLSDLLGAVPQRAFSFSDLQAAGRE